MAKYSLMELISPPQTRGIAHRSGLRLVASLLLASALTAQQPNTAVDPLRHLTTNVWRLQDGLSDQVVQAVAEGPDHFLWIGTPSGLLRFDGESFLPYAGAGQEALSHGVTCLTLASDGSLYAGTEGGGIVRFHGSQTRVYGQQDGLTDPLLRAILEDSRHRIWAGTDHGVFLLEADAFRPAVSPARYPNLGTAALMEDRSGAIWVGGSTLLRVEDTGLEEYKLPTQSGSMRVKALAQDQDGTILVGAIAGLFQRAGDDRFRAVREVQGSVRMFGRLPSGELLIGTAGYGLYARHNGRFNHANSDEILPSKTILSSARDNDGTTWLGTQGGLVRLNRTGMELIDLPGSNSDFGTLSMDRDGSLWSSSNHVYHLSQGIVSPYHFPFLRSEIVRTVMQETGAARWVGTAGNGAFRVEPGHPPAHFTSEIGTNYMRGFLEGRDGSVWIATDGGVSQWKSGRITNFHRTLGAPHTLVLAMAEGSSGQLWLGTQRGLFRLDHGRFIQTPSSPALPDGPVWAVHEDSSGTLWMGTNSGLFAWNNGSLHHVNLRREEENQAVFAILEAPNGFFWISGPNRVQRVQHTELLHAIASRTVPAAVPTDSFFTTDTSPSAELFAGMQPAGVLAPDGSAWFPSSEGPLHVSAPPESSIRVTDLILKKILVDGVATPAASPLSLPAGTRSLEIHYGPLLLGSHADIAFRRRLYPFEEWNASHKSGVASYTSLPAGEYDLQIEALDSNLRVVARTHLKVIQGAFFYQKAWFWTLCVLLLLSLVWLLHALKIRRVKASFRAVSEERNRLAREIHDTVLQGCTAVSALLEAASAHAAGGERIDHWMRSARDQIRSTIDEARAAVWDLRTRADEESLESSLRKMAQQDSDAKGADVSFRKLGHEPGLSPRVTHELMLGTREALLNAMMHSAATRIEMELHCSPEAIQICVIDNGMGFSASDPVKTTGHFGIKGMRERMEKIGGRCEIASTPEQGTEIRLSYRRDHRERNRKAKDRP